MLSEARGTAEEVSIGGSVLVHGGGGGGKGVRRDGGRGRREARDKILNLKEVAHHYEVIESVFLSCECF